MLFWVMTPKYSWPISLQDIFWVVWLVKLNIGGPLLHREYVKAKSLEREG